MTSWLFIIWMKTKPHWARLTSCSGLLTAGHHFQNVWPFPLCSPPLMCNMHVQDGIRVINMKLFMPLNRLTAGYKSSYWDYSREIDRERSSASHRHQVCFSADFLSCCEHFLARTHFRLVPSGKRKGEIQPIFHAALKVSPFYSVDYSGTYSQISLLSIVVCQQIHWDFCSWCEDNVSASMENVLK